MTFFIVTATTRGASVAETHLNTVPLHASILHLTHERCASHGRTIHDTALPPGQQLWQAATAEPGGNVAAAVVLPTPSADHFQRLASTKEPYKEYSPQGSKGVTLGLCDRMPLATAR